MKFKINFIIIVALFITKILYSQIAPNSFYLNGNKKLAKTTAESAPNSNSITDIVALGDTIWLGTGQGVSLTTDGGNNWTNFNFGSESESAMGYNKYNGVFWAATAHDENTSSGNVSTGSGLRYTSDNGKTWTTIKQPVDADSDSLIVYGINNLKALPVTVPQQNVTYDIAFTPGTVWIASWAAGLRKSTDMGKSWQRVVLPADYLNSISPTDTLDFCYSPVSGKICNTGNLNLEGFSVVAVDSLTLFVGTAGGINKSTDGGISWTKFNHLNQTSPISGNWVVALAYNHFDNTLWAATRRANGETEGTAVSYTADGGDTWQTTLPNQTVWNFAVNDNQVIAVADDGAFKTNDFGSNWISAGTVADASSGISIKINTYYSAAFESNNIWLGSGEGLAELTGNYSGWLGTWKVFTASKALSSATDTYAYPNPFNPNTDVLKIKYSTNGSSVPVTIRIFDFSMHFVKTIIQDAQRGSTTHVVDSANGTIDYWNGRNDKGNMVPNGVYFYRVNAGSEKPVYGKILVLH
jgi:hypothetical protein